MAFSMRTGVDVNQGIAYTHNMHICQPIVHATARMEVAVLHASMGAYLLACIKSIVAYSPAHCRLAAHAHLHTQLTGECFSMPENGDRRKHTHLYTG